MRNTLLIGGIVAIVIFLFAFYVLKHYKIGVPVVPIVLVSIFAAGAGSINTIKHDSGLSFLGHLLVAIVLALCITGAAAGFFSLTGQLPGMPKWVAGAIILVGIFLFLMLAGLLGGGPR